MRGLARGGAAFVFSLVTAASWLTCGSAFAATLVLNDGSVIRGDIKTLQEDVYTVETDALGTVRVQKQDIRTIDLNDEGARGSPPLLSTGSSPVGQAELQALQTQLMQSPDLVSMIQGLQSDPEVQAVLADPEIMSALAAGDLAKLMSHPKIIALTGNPKVREIVEGVQ